MPITEQFMKQNVEALSSIAEFAKNIDENLSKIGEMLDEKFATIDKVTGSPTGAPTGGGGGAGAGAPDFNASLMTLNSSVNHLAGVISSAAAKEGGGGVEGGNISTLKELGEIGGSVGKFARSLALSVPMFAIARPFVGLITGTISKFIVDIAQKVSADDVQKAKGVGEMMMLIGSGILGFAAKMALATPLLIVAAPGILILRLLSGSILSIAQTFSKGEKDIKSASGSINRISISMIGFAGSLALSAMIVSSLGTESIGPLAVLFGGMALSALAFMEIGKRDGDIGKGALGMLLMSASIAIFAVAFSYAAEQISEVGFSGLGMTLLALVGIGGAYLLAGQFWDKIALGALAFGLAGLSLFLLAPNIATMAETLNENPHAMWQIPLTLVGIGGAFALAGIPVVAGFIALGAIALGLAGGALWVIGKGVGAFMDAISSAPDDAGDQIESVLTGVINGFGKGFSDLSVAEALTLPLKIPMVAMMGGALALLGMGLGKYKRASQGWGYEDTDTLANTIQELSRVFALSGSTEGMNKIFGFSIGSNDTERGIESTMRMGRNLKILAGGIKEWKNLALSQDDVQLISDNIGRVLNFIPAIFADIGMRERQSSNQMDVFGVKFGVPFTSTDTELGIEATEDMGRNLKDLADGILAWKNMALSAEDIQIISTNVGRVLNTIPAIFATIGARERGSTGKMSFFGMEFDNPFSSGDVELGIAATKDLGGTLKDLAEGVLAWKEGGEGGFKLEDVPGIAANISAILNVIPKAFAEVGKADKDTEGLWFWSDGDMERGIEIVEDIVDPLKDVASLMNTFKDIKRPDIEGYRVGKGLKAMLLGLNIGLLNLKDSEVDRFERLMKPLKKLPSVFKDVNEEIKKHVEYLGNLPETYMMNFDRWASGMQKISELDTASLEKSFEMSRKVSSITGTVSSAPAVTTGVVEEGTSPSKTVTKPSSKESPNVIAKKTTKESQHDATLKQLMATMQQLIASNNQQSSELAAIKEQLATGIRTIDGSPLG